MPITPGARRKLADLMDDRRAELRLRWRDVADLGGVSYEVIRAVRNGTGEIRTLTQRGIETGLRWSPGSVRAILGDGDPRPAGEPDTLPPMSDDERRAILSYLEVRRAAERGA